MNARVASATLRAFENSDSEAAIALWRSTQWASVSASDTPAEIAKLLQRNPGLSWVAIHDGELVGTVLCGQDGRRGYIYHLVVSDAQRGRGIGAALLARALNGLRAAGILKCHAMVIDGNPSAEYFWQNGGWERQQTAQYSLILSE